MSSFLPRAFLALFLAAGLVPSPALAQRGGPPPGPSGPLHHRDPAPIWHGDIHRFHDHDFDLWRGGRWFHGPHGERDGWWWIVGGVWYFYPSPVYPYPDPYTPPTVVVETTPGTTVYWSCANPSGYYPYVTECFAPWQKVVSTQTVIAPPPAMVAPQPTLSQRERDDRTLNAFAVELQNIDMSRRNKKAALAQLHGLRDRLEAFRQTLFERDYNAMDILRDAERLRDRVDAQGATLKAPKSKKPLAP